MKKVAIATLGALTATAALAQAPAPVNVGVLLDYTGALAEFGPNMQNGAILAAEQINAAAELVFGGPLINLVFEDGATNAAVAVDRARKLVDTDGVVAIVGSLASGVTIAVSEAVAIPSQVPIISPASTSPLLTIMADDDFVFRTTASDATQGVVAAQLARGELIDGYSFDRAGILYINSPYGQGLADVFAASFEARGGTVVGSVAHPEEPQPTYAAQLESLLAGNPDFILAVGYPGQATVYMTEARDLYGFTSWQFVDGTQSLEILEAVGADVLEGQYGTAPGSDPEWEGAARFVEQFSAAYGEVPPLPFIDTTYDAVVSIALAVAQAHADGVAVDSVAVRDRLRAVNADGGDVVGVGDYVDALSLIASGAAVNYSGAAGEVDFDENGDVVTPVILWQFSGGTIVDAGVRRADEIPAE